MKNTDLAIMDAMDAVEKVKKLLDKEEHDAVDDEGNDVSASWDYKLGKLAVVKWTLRSLLS